MNAQVILLLLRMNLYFLLYDIFFLYFIAIHLHLLYLFFSILFNGFLCSQ